MTSHRLWTTTALAALTTFALSACGHTVAGTTSEPAPVQLAPVAGSDLKTVTLTDQARRRLGITTSPVASVPAGGATPALAIPYSAIVYDENGGTWAFVSHQPLTYVREPVSVEHIAGETAVLSRGPAAGTTVVTVGSAELLGAEYQIGGEG